MKNYINITFSSTGGGPEDDPTEVMDCGSWLDARDSSVVVAPSAASATSGGVEFSLSPSGESGSDLEDETEAVCERWGCLEASEDAAAAADSLGGEGVLEARSRDWSGCGCCCCCCCC